MVSARYVNIHDPVVGGMGMSFVADVAVWNMQVSAGYEWIRRYLDEGMP